jgi:predicted DNA-binding transcriptional regulator AlpA
MPFSEAGFTQLENAISRRQLLTTNEARALFHLSEQRWLRLTTRVGFPKRIREGRRWVIDPSELLSFLHLYDAIAACISISQVAMRTQRTVKTLRSMIAKGEFPGPIGTVRNIDKFDVAAITEWQQRQRHGLKAPSSTRRAAA